MPFGSTSYICQINADAFHLAKQRVRSHAVQSRRLPLRNALLQRRYKSGVFVASAGHSQDLPIKSAQQLRLWTAVDATATIGSIAGALAFFVTSEALLAGIPVILPLLAWYADRRKESLQVEAAIQRAASTWQVQNMSPSAASDRIASALQQLQKDSQQQQAMVKHIKSIEAKLNALEGSVLTAGLNAQEAARQVSTCSDQVAQRTQAQIKDFTASVQSNGLAALQRLDAHLTTIQGAIAGLEAAQKQSAGVLPEAVAAALPSALLQAQQSGMLPEAVNSSSTVREGSLSIDGQDQLRRLVAGELSQVTQQIVAAQAAAVQPIQPAMNESLFNQLAQVEQRLQDLQETRSAKTFQDASPELHAVQSLLDAALEGMDKDSTAASSVTHAQADLRKVIDKMSAVPSTPATAAPDQEQLNKSLTELHQTQLIIQRELATLQAAVSQSNLPVEERPGQEAAVDNQEAVLANTESLLHAMEAFQSSLTQQVEGVAAEVAQLSAAQPLPAASGGSAGNAAAASDQMPASVEAAVSGPAQDPQERVQNPQDGKQTAYERMQALLQQRNGSNSEASTSGQEDPTPVAGGSNKPPTDQGTALNQRSSNSSGIQQQFLFAAGLAAAGEVPLDTTEEQWWDQQNYKGSGQNLDQPPQRAGQEQQQQQQQQPQPQLQPQADQQTQPPWWQQSEQGSDQDGIQWYGSQQTQTDQWSSQQSGLSMSPSQTSARDSSLSSDQFLAPGDQQRSSDSPQSSSGVQSSNSSVSSSSSSQDSVSLPSPVSDDSLSQSVNSQQGQVNSDQVNPDVVQRQGAAGSQAASVSGDDLASQPSYGSGQIGFEQEMQPPVQSGDVGVEPLEVEQMSFEERLQAGHECFRSARREVEEGSLGAASSLMTAALNYYEAASHLDATDVKLLGRWGNALLAYGGLKKRLLEAVMDAPSPGPVEASAVAASKAQILREASDALIDAGHKFQAIAQQNIEDTRALTNWAKSICIRASLKDQPEDAMRLYSSAVDKFEKVLALQPDNVSVMVTCGLALKDMALCMSLDDPDTLINLEDAETCMQQALSIDGANQAAEAGLAECQDRLRICRQYNAQYS